MTHAGKADAEVSCGYESLVCELREEYQSGRTRTLAWRKSQLNGLLEMVQEKEAEIFDALHYDVGKHRNESFRDEVGALKKSINLALQDLKKWMAPDKVSLPLIAFPATAALVPEPLGVVLIFSCWNFPLGLSLEPLIGAVAAGNAVAVKTSEYSGATAKFLATNIPKYLDGKAVKIMPGGPDVATQLLEQKWDKILFTGSPRVGRIVMAAAAKHLTPVALELGGKCPAIIDALKSPRDWQHAMNRIVGAKWSLCAGQGCVAIDYLIVEEQFASVVVGKLKETMEKFFTKAEFMARIVNDQHFKRLTGLLKDPAVEASIVHGGSSDAKNLYIEPTILLNPPLDSDIMTEEIFGPLLPIVTLKKIEDSISFLRARPKPLVIYAFTNDASLQKRIIEETSSGSVAFNDAVVQYAIDTFPFGGVGPSGFGQYHGKYSFEMFSHNKPVLWRSLLLDFDLRYPPWNERKMKYARLLYNYDYIGAVLYFLRLKK